MCILEGIMAKVLIIDDSKTSRKFLRDMIVKGGHEVAGEAVNGLEGLEMYQKLHPDVVTMDITMPIMDGIEAVGEIIKIDPEAKVIMVTAAGQKCNIVEAVKRGAADFVQKPFDGNVLINVIEKVLDE
jgi:two-component system chemotaxis response regulator CheY